MIAFGFAVAVTALLPVFLQKPLKSGGDGFNPLQYAAFTFFAWIGVIFAEVYGMLLNDRLPLLMCRRRGRNWKPHIRCIEHIESNINDPGPIDGIWKRKE